MCFGLLLVKESPRWLASRGRTHEALRNLAYLRKEHPDSESVLHEMAEIEAAIEEEREVEMRQWPLLKVIVRILGETLRKCFKNLKYGRPKHHIK